MEPVAFLSYAYLDDAGSVRELSFFHDSLQSELRIQTGLPVHIFFDKKSIRWGARWVEVINKGLEGSAFLMPILTPSFFQSEACKGEYLKFLEVEERIGRRDLILPIYYVKCREIENTSTENVVARDIRNRQYRNWKEMRLKPRDSADVMKEFAELASIMSETFFDIKETIQLTHDKKLNKINRDTSNRNYTTEILGKDITYENLVAYSVGLMPELPVSAEWTRFLLNDIDRGRYKVIGDIDKEVNYSRSKVTEYARENPSVFRYSTDYITKSLIFTDDKFRSTHDVSPETLNKAITEDIKR